MSTHDAVTTGSPHVCAPDLSTLTGAQLRAEVARRQTAAFHDWQDTWGWLPGTGALGGPAPARTDYPASA